MLDMKLGLWRNYPEGRAAIRHYANQPTCPSTTGYNKYKYLALATFLPGPVVSRVDINNNNTTPGRDLMIWTGDSVGDDGLWCGQLYKQTAASILVSAVIVMAQRENWKYLLQVQGSGDSCSIMWPGALQRDICSRIHTNSAEPCPAQTHRSLQSLDRAQRLLFERCVYLCILTVCA